MSQRIISSPLGEILIEIRENIVVKIEFVDNDHVLGGDDHPLLDIVENQLDEYFKGIRKNFDLPLSYSGTNFQEEVWTALQTIPYGSMWSYQQLAESIGRDKAVRAVGQANKRNPLTIVIPCHRVIGKNGTMTGYAGLQIDKKEILLQLEGSFKN